jgi:ataxin-10
VDEIIAPHQTTLLKLLDSYLQSSKESTIHRQLCPMLSETFFTMMEYAQHAIRRALGPNASDGPSSGLSGIVNIEVTSEGTAPPQNLDLFLPKVCEALVLITQCIATITLEEEQFHQDASRRVDSNVYELRTAFNEARSGGGYGLIESLLGLPILSTITPAHSLQPTELLRLLDLFLPRINFGKPVAQIPQGAIADPTGFSYLKRDLVRLLGILCQRTKEVQDRVRFCGGIPVVMNLCVVDERNPCMSRSPSRSFCIAGKGTDLFIPNLVP